MVLYENHFFLIVWAFAQSFTYFLVTGQVLPYLIHNAFSWLQPRAIITPATTIPPSMHSKPKKLCAQFQNRSHAKTPHPQPLHPRQSDSVIRDKYHGIDTESRNSSINVSCIPQMRAPNTNTIENSPFKSHLNFRFEFSKQHHQKNIISLSFPPRRPTNIAQGLPNGDSPKPSHLWVYPPTKHPSADSSLSIARTSTFQTTKKSST